VYLVPKAGIILILRCQRRIFNLVKRRTDVRKSKRRIDKGLKVAKKVTKQKFRTAGSLLHRGFGTNPIEELNKLGKKYGIESEFKKDYGFGQIDLVWNIRFHSAFDPITCGFIQLKEQESGSRDLDDGQFSLRKIEEAVMIGIRSGMDKIYILCDNEAIAKSVTGQIEWLSSFGSLIRFDAYSSAFFQAKKTNKIKSA
jgi:hypothetical protein